MNWRENLSIDVRSFLFGPPEERGAGGRSAWRGPFYLRQNRRWRDLIMVTDQMTAIVFANASLPDGFDAATADAPTYPMKRMFAAMANDLDSGMALHESAAWRSRFFPKFYVDMLRTGEETGRLNETFDSLRAILQRTWELRTRAVQYGAYIGLVWLVLIVISFLIPAYIIPIFKDMLKEFSTEPPALLAYAESYVIVGPLRSVFFFVLFLFLWKIAALVVRHSAVASALVGRVALSFPLTRELVSKRNLAHAAFTLAKFLRARVPLNEALESAANLGLNAVYRRAFIRVSDRVASGASFKAALESERVFPESFIGFASMGETSGLLPEALERVEQLYRRQVARTERVLLDVVSPIGILAAGAFVLLFFSYVIVSLAGMADSIAMP
ncbi:MAG: type II secretion system F family protein [FCB group bacterium]|jgi:type IV pilus assembly protein PilC|nr:type II secretion system F family protein [FCB group bacterium]